MRPDGTAPGGPNAGTWLYNQGMEHGRPHEQERDHLVDEQGFQPGCAHPDHTGILGSTDSRRYPYHRTGHWDGISGEMRNGSRLMIRRLREGVERMDMAW